MLKVAWRLLSEQDNLWARVVRGKYLKQMKEGGRREGKGSYQICGGEFYVFSTDYRRGYCGTLEVACKHVFGLITGSKKGLQWWISHQTYWSRLGA
ncbi:unnamed protein product [Linum trigynum]|uniref:Uncharacterized protein n=1 Tax=Linum trigynum TaxID=586398 RepID=A0AAV2FYB9_9ROSI